MADQDITTPAAEKPSPPQWRTVIAMTICCITMAGLAYLFKGAGEFGEKMFGSSVYGLVFFLTVVGGAHGFQHLTSGAGVGGIAAAFMNGANAGAKKPDDKPEESTK